MVQKNTQKLLFLIILFLIAIISIRNYDYIVQWYVYRSYSARCPGENYKIYQNFNTHLPTGFSVHGIDVSHFCCEVDWKRVSQVEMDSVRIQFAFFRSTSGASGIDFQFKNNWDKSKEHGIIRGAYHYFKPGESPEKQARHFLNIVKIEKGDLPPVLDIETVEGSTLPELIRDLRIWLETVEKSCGIKPILYTNIYHLNTYFGERFKDYPLWIANYQSKTLNFTVERSWWFWQHSNSGRINGCSQPVDFNVFNGTFEELKSLCKQ